jgi:hypothetical protein
MRWMPSADALTPAWTVDELSVLTTDVVQGPFCQ